MPKPKAIALKPPKTIKLQGKSSLRMGAPPVFGKPLITGCVALGPAVGPVVGTTVDVGGSVAVEVGSGAAQPVMVFMLSVTAACARARPFKLAPACILMLVPARMLPIMEELVKISAAEPSLHHTLHASPPVTDEPTAVVSVVSALKIQTPDPTRVRFPVSKKASAQ